MRLSHLVYRLPAAAANVSLCRGSAAIGIELRNHAEGARPALGGRLRATSTFAPPDSGVELGVALI